MFGKIAAPVLSLSLFISGNTLFTTLLSLYAHDVSKNTYLPAMIAASFFAGLVFGSIRCIRYIERVGHIRAFASFASLSVMICLLHIWFNMPSAWIGLRFFSGYACAGLYIVVESWLLALSEKETRGRLLAIYMVSFYLAQSLGQFLLNIPVSNKLEAYSIVAILFAVSIFPVADTWQKSPVIDEPSFFSFKDLYRLSPLSILGCFMAGLNFGALYALGPIYAEQSSLSLSQIALFMGALIFGGALLQWPIGRMSDYFGRRQVLILICLLGMLVCAGIIWLEHYSFVGLIVMITLLGGLAFTIYPVSISHATDYVDSKDIVAATSGLLIANGVGSVLGPLFASVFMHFLGEEGLFIFIALVCCCLILFAVWRIQQRAAMPIEEQGDYVPLPRTSPKVTELDPRLDEHDKL